MAQSRPISNITITDIVLRPSQPLEKASDHKKYKARKKALTSNPNFWTEPHEHIKHAAIGEVRFKNFTGECKTTTQCCSFELFGSPRAPSYERLKNHLILLIKIASKYHRDTNFSVDGTIRPEAVNHIVRLLPYEFAFYTKEPLTQEQLQYVINSINKLEALSLPNLHLVFNFAVLSKTQHAFHNMVVYIECGRNPVVRYFAKQNSSWVDASYLTTDIEEGINLTVKQRIENAEDKGTPSRLNQVKIEPHYFTATTAGDESFGILLDICIDHSLTPATDDFLKHLLTQKNSAVGTHIVDRHHHLIIANKWLTPLLNNLITSSVTNTDPYYGASYSDVGIAIGTVKLPACAYYIPPDPRSKARVSVNKNRVTITNADFGPSICHLIIYQPSQVKRITNTVYADLIREANLGLTVADNKSTPLEANMLAHKIMSILKFLIMHPSMLLDLNKSVLLIIASYLSGMAESDFLTLRKVLFKSHLNMYRVELPSGFLSRWEEANTPKKLLSLCNSTLFKKPHFLSHKAHFLEEFPENLPPTPSGIRRELQ
jgi:hypothetical protein